MKKKLFLLILLSMSHVSFADDSSVEEELKGKCMSAFDIIKDNNAEAFISMLPNSIYDKEEVQQINKYVEKLHSKYIVRDKGWRSLTFKKIRYVDVQPKNKEKFGATKEALAYFRLIHNSGKKRTTHCTFVNVDQKWFLADLP